MKKVVLFIVSLMLLMASCSNNKISVHGEIGNKYNGETVYLYNIDPNTFSDLNLLATATVENGTFTFEDLDGDAGLQEKDLPCVGYISLFDMNMTEDELTEENSEAPMATVILETGIAKVVFSENSVEVSGTESNTEFNKMHQAIKKLVDFSSQFMSVEELDSAPTNEEGKDGRAQLQDLDKELRDQSYLFIKANIQNNVGEYLFLRSSDDMFTPMQTIELIDLSSSSFKARPEVVKLKNDLDGISLGVPQIDSTLDSVE